MLVRMRHLVSNGANPKNLVRATVCLPIIVRIVSEAHECTDSCKENKNTSVQSPASFTVERFLVE